MEICRFDAEKLIPKIAEECDPIYAFTYFQLFLSEREKYPRESFEDVWERLPTFTEDVHAAMRQRAMSH